MEERKLSVANTPIDTDCKKADDDEDCKSNLHRWINSGSFRTCSLFATIPVRLVACGEGHVIIVAYSSQVFSVGSNEYGQLGLGDRVDRKTPREVNFLSEKFVNSISSGPRHCCAISKTGQVFSWGDSRCGQCGQGEKGIFTTPCRVRFIERNTESKMGPSNQRSIIVQDVSCGEQHTLAIDSQGALWSWGSGLATGLGQGDEEILVPKKVTKMSKKRVVQITCGKYHSIALVQEDVNVNQDTLKNEIICSSPSDEGSDTLSRVGSNVTQKIPFLENVFYVEEEDSAINWSMDLQKLSRSNTPPVFYSEEDVESSKTDLEMQAENSDVSLHETETPEKDASIDRSSHASVGNQLEEFTSNRPEVVFSDDKNENSVEPHKPLEFGNKLIGFLEQESTVLDIEKDQNHQSSSSAETTTTGHLIASSMSKSADNLVADHMQKDNTNQSDETMLLLNPGNRDTPVEVSDVELVEASTNDLYYSALDVMNKQGNSLKSKEFISNTVSSSGSINASCQSFENQSSNSHDPLSLSINKSMENMILSEHCSFAVDESHAEKTASVSSYQSDNSTIRDRSISTWSIDTAGSTYEIDRLGSPQLYGISQVWAWGENSHGQLGIGDSTLVIKER